MDQNVGNETFLQILAMLELWYFFTVAVQVENPGYSWQMYFPSASSWIKIWEPNIAPSPCNAETLEWYCLI
jgi:hypothetical protein